LCHFSINVIGLLPKEEAPVPHEREAFLYDEKSILVEGLAQAQNLANTVVLEKGLPEPIEKLAQELKVPQEMHSRVQEYVLFI
jgi:hypothetical protein